MADDVDAASIRQLQLESLAVASVRFAAANIPSGHEGYCDKCGNGHLRLMGADFFKSKQLPRVAESIVEGICPPCRDRFKLP